MKTERERHAGKAREVRVVVEGGAREAGWLKAR
jgi:hypothetical protein